MTGERPPHPQNARWLRDEIWDMIEKCWSGQREPRWDARRVSNHPSISSFQEPVEDQRGPSSSAIEDPSPSANPPEEPRVPTQGPSTVVAPGTQLTREAPRSNETEQKATPYKIETPLREPTPPPRKVRGPVPLVPKEPKVVGGGIANKPASRLQPPPCSTLPHSPYSSAKD